MYSFCTHCELRFCRSAGQTSTPTAKIYSFYSIDVFFLGLEIEHVVIEEPLDTLARLISSLIERLPVLYELLLLDVVKKTVYLRFEDGGIGKRKASIVQGGEDPQSGFLGVRLNREDDHMLGDVVEELIDREAILHSSLLEARLESSEVLRVVVLMPLCCRAGCQDIGEDIPELRVHDPRFEQGPVFEHLASQIIFGPYRFLDLAHEVLGLLGFLSRLKCRVYRSQEQEERRQPLLPVNDLVLTLILEEHDAGEEAVLALVLIAGRKLPEIVEQGIDLLLIPLVRTLVFRNDELVFLAL